RSRRFFERSPVPAGMRADGRDLTSRGRCRDECLITGRPHGTRPPATSTMDGFPMRRIALLLTVVGLMTAGLGCKHVGGKCDCLSNPADAAPLPPTTPYPAQHVGTVPVQGAPTAPMPMR